MKILIINGKKVSLSWLLPRQLPREVLGLCLASLICTPVGIAQSLAQGSATGQDGIPLESSLALAGSTHCQGDGCKTEGRDLLIIRHRGEQLPVRRPDP